MELYTLDQVAEMLKLSVRTVREYCNERRIPSVMIGNKYRIRKIIVEQVISGELEIGPKEKKE